MKKNTRIYCAALILFVAGLGYLIVAGLKSSTSYHLDVAEALVMKNEELQGVRVFGVVSAEGLERAPGTLGARFFLQDQRNPATVMEVAYKGAVPEGFKPGAEIYAEGSCTPGSKALQATGLNATCPSKYKKENRK